jgi:hypothetical protein
MAGHLLQNSRILQTFTEPDGPLPCSWHPITDPQHQLHYMGADKSLARPGRKQATATEDFDAYISYL